MDSKPFALILAVVIGVSLVGIVFTIPIKGGSASEVASSPAACAAHNFLVRVIENATGTLFPTCSQPSYADLTGHVGTPNETASTCNNWFLASNESSAGVHACKLAIYSQRITANISIASGSTSTLFTFPSVTGFSIQPSTRYVWFVHMAFIGTLQWKVTYTGTGGTLLFCTHAPVSVAGIAVLSTACTHVFGTLIPGSASSAPASIEGSILWGTLFSGTVKGTMSIQATASGGTTATVQQDSYILVEQSSN